MVQTVAKNSYKYFKYPVNPGQKEITLVLNDIDGETRLSHSFDDTRPKDDAEYIKDDQRIKRSAYSKDAAKTNYYWIANPEGFDKLYVSARGYGESNTFKIVAFNRTFEKAPITEEEFNFQGSVHGSGVKQIALVAVFAQIAFFYF